MNRSHLSIPPLFSQIISNRLVTICLLVFVMAQECFLFLGFPGWQCPVNSALGINCPTCGMSRAIAALFKGDIQSMLILHPFAPVIVFAGCIMGISVVLPSKQRNLLIKTISSIETKTGISIIFIAFLLVYWLARLISGYI